MTGFTLLLILALAVLVWWVLDTARARDAARAHAARYCREMSVQLLDQTVALDHTRVVRSRGGQFGLQRGFRFEFSETGSDRWPGRIQLIGPVATGIVLEGQRIGRVVAGRDDDR